MRNILLFILVLFSCSVALAQDEAAPGDAPGDEPQATDETIEDLQPEIGGADLGLIFGDYNAVEFGFTIPIPTIGYLETPDSFGWKLDPEVAFVWSGDEGSPVSMIELRADRIGTDITPEQYGHFYDALVKEWEDQPTMFKVTRSRREPYHFGAMDWLIVEVEDKSAAAAVDGLAQDGIEGAQAAAETVYYTIFTTFHNEVFYTIGFYYLKPVNSAVEQMAVPMLRGFSVTE